MNPVWPVNIIDTQKLFHKALLFPKALIINHLTKKKRSIEHEYQGLQMTRCIIFVNNCHGKIFFDENDQATWFLLIYHSRPRAARARSRVCDCTGFSTTFLPSLVPYRRLYMWLRVLLTSRSLLAYLATLACRVLHLCKLTHSFSL